MEVWVAQSCQTLCNPMDCSPPGSSVHGILQERILECVVIPFSRGWIFLTQGLNLGLLHCRQILYHLSHINRYFTKDLQMVNKHMKRHSTLSLLGSYIKNPITIHLSEWPKHKSHAKYWGRYEETRCLFVCF